MLTINLLQSGTNELGVSLFPGEAAVSFEKYPRTAIAGFEKGREGKYRETGIRRKAKVKAQEEGRKELMTR